MMAHGEPGVLAAAAGDALREARAALSEARDLLLEPTPDRLGECGGRLEKVGELLRGLEAALRGGPGAGGRPEGAARAKLGAGVEELRRELAVVGKLLHHAGRYYLNWARMLLGAAEAYTSKGEAAGLAAPGRVLAEG